MSTRPDGRVMRKPTVLERIDCSAGRLDAVYEEIYERVLCHDRDNKQFDSAQIAELEMACVAIVVAADRLRSCSREAFT